MRKIRMLALFMILIGSMVLSGCFKPQPTVSDVQKKLTKNIENLETVVAFLESTGYDDISICAPKKMYADFSYVIIEDEAVVAALEELHNKGNYPSIQKNGSTITFRQWQGLTGISCGIAHVPYDWFGPDIQYLTELVSLQEDCWYYYVEDYETWRLEH